ncbi:MAG TPA: dual specificity protein phosphatase family protein [Phycisphaerae bacterium]|nr:dual specificity protein phosphatase family protein [Phycisphaerae bacterium]
MKKAFLLALFLLAPPGAVIGWREYQTSQKFPHRFAEVEPGALYRGGYPTAENIENLKHEHNIKTVISLTDERENNAEERKMLETVDRLGLKFFRIKMPGDGRADFTSLDMAADAMANKQNWPVFFHCAAGKQRSNAALAAYRLKYEGWPVERTIDDLKRYDLDPAQESPLCEHLRQYSRWVASHRPLPPVAASRPVNPTRPGR